MPERIFSVEAPVKGFPVTFLFNQFSVDKDGDWSVLTVGYFLKGRFLDDVLSFALSKEVIELSKESTLNYLGRTGEILRMDRYIPLPQASRILPVNIINMAFRGDVAELALANFAFKRINVESSESIFEADPVALLRSSLDVQRHLIQALYAKN